MESRHVVKCGGKGSVWAFQGERIFLCVMLCCSCSGGNYEAAWYHSTSIEGSSLNQYFSIHDTRTELLTVHSAGQVKRTKLPCVLLSCPVL